MATHKANGQPWKMLNIFLDIFFTREILAESKAGKDEKKAHNTGTGVETTPFNIIVISAIRDYILLTFKKQNGEACMSDTIFNEVINNKCGTSRRGLKGKK